MPLTNGSVQKLPLVHWFWARRVLLEKYPGIRDLKVEGHPDMTPEEFVDRYMMWALYQGVLHIFGSPEPCAMLIVRRLSSDKAERYFRQYYQTIYEQDEDGDTAWVEWCWAPGNYPFIVSFLKSLGTEYIAWTHEKTGKFHFVRSCDLKDKSMMGTGSLGTLQAQNGSSA